MCKGILQMYQTWPVYFSIFSDDSLVQKQIPVFIVRLCIRS